MGAFALHLAAVLLLAPPPATPAPRVVALQPLGTVGAGVVETVRAAVGGFWGVEVVVLPAAALPRAAFYEPRQRYRADRLLDWLSGVEVAAERVVGLTTKDISVTKGAFPDWGIFGLGALGGRGCVVSTFRLGRGGATPAVAAARLVKVVNHELGHTWGLPHCSTPRCLMEDAAGTIATVDAEPGELCRACRRVVQTAGLGGGARALQVGPEP